MARSKIIINGETYIDLTGDTAVASDVALGKTFHLADGTITTGTASGGGGSADLKGIIERTAVTPTLPSDLTAIGIYAFRQCTSLALTELPSGVTSIGNYAFYQCTNLALTELPSGVTSIGINAFYQCTNLALTELPSGVTSIGASAFYQCTNLALTELPSGVTSIGANAFYQCTNLALTELPSGVTSIGIYAFRQCTNLALTELPSGVTSIGANAFYQCISLTSISCEGVITTLGGSAFVGSSDNPMQLKSISFPNMAVSSLTTAFGSSISANACNLLEFADIGNTKAIAANAFAYCYALETLVIRRSDAICTLSNVSAFTNTPMRGYNSLTGKVYVPSALIATYQTATNWSTLYDNGTVEFVAIEGSEYER